MIRTGTRTEPETCTRQGLRQGLGRNRDGHGHRQGQGRDRDMDTDRDRKGIGTWTRTGTGTGTGTGMGTWTGTWTGMGKGKRTGIRTRIWIQKGTRTFPRGIRPLGTTFEFEYLSKFETEFDNNLRYESGVYIYGVDLRKNSGRKSHATVPLKSSQ
jgi:hypothetical protein